MGASEGTKGGLAKTAWLQGELAVRASWKRWDRDKDPKAHVVEAAHPSVLQVPNKPRASDAHHLCEQSTAFSRPLCGWLWPPDDRLAQV